LAAWASQGEGIERLVAIDLLARLRSAIRKIEPQIRPLLEAALRAPLPPLSLVAEKRALPEGAEPAEIRESVAKALNDAGGDWVLAYAVTAFVAEDRSQRARLALWHPVTRRSRSIDAWLSHLLHESARQNIAAGAGIEAAAGRLRDICAALAEVIAHSRHRLDMTERAGALLADLARALVPLRAEQAVPRHLGEAGTALARLLDALAATRLRLITEAELYRAVPLLRQWWSPLPYPPEVTEAMAPLVDKLVAGIVFRARAGRRSPGLCQHLEEALTDEKDARARMIRIAESEPGLAPEIADWLRGIERVAPEAAAADTPLAAVSAEGFLRAFAPLFLAASEAETAPDPDRAARLASLAKAVGAAYGLELVGKPGDAVRYAPLAYEAADGKAPDDAPVRLARPMVVRRRGDRGMDVILKGLVTRL
jgi:hypothetical protein